jgi:hypothetical protein
VREVKWAYQEHRVHKAQVDSQAKKVLKENAENQVSDVMEELVTPDPLVSLFWLFLFFDV